jgi:hypothetical protein
MALKRDKDGNIEWTAEQEEDIEIATEARVRARKRVKAMEAKEDADASCNKGTHATLNDKGECSNCGKKPQNVPSPEPRRKNSLRM